MDVFGPLIGGITPFIPGGGRPVRIPTFPVIGGPSVVGPVTDKPVDNPSGNPIPVNKPPYKGGPLDSSKSSIGDLLANPYVMYGGAALGVYVVYRMVKRNK